MEYLGLHNMPKAAVHPKKKKKKKKKKIHVVSRKYYVSGVAINVCV